MSSDGSTPPSSSADGTHKREHSPSPPASPLHAPTTAPPPTIGVPPPAPANLNPAPAPEPQPIAPAQPRLTIAPNPATLLMGGPHRVPGVNTPAAPAIGPLPTPTTSRAPTPMALDVGAPIFGGAPTGTETPPWTPSTFRNPSSMDSLSITELMTLPPPPPLSLAAASSGTTPNPNTTSSSNTATTSNVSTTAVTPPVGPTAIGLGLGEMMNLTSPLGHPAAAAAEMIPISAVAAKSTHATFSIITSSLPQPSSGSAGYYSGSEWSDSEPTPRKPPAQRPKLMMTSTPTHQQAHTPQGTSPSSAASDASAATMLMPPPTLARPPRKSSMGTPSNRASSRLGASSSSSTQQQTSTTTPPSSATTVSNNTTTTTSTSSNVADDMTLFVGATAAQHNPSSSQATPESVPAGDPPLPLLLSGGLPGPMSTITSTASPHHLPTQLLSSGPKQQPSVQQQQQQQTSVLMMASMLGKRKLTMEESGDNHLLTSKQHCQLCGKCFEEGQNVRTLPGCGHTFHVGCIDHHLEQGDHHCPIDKQDIVSSLPALTAAAAAETTHK